MRDLEYVAGELTKGKNLHLNLPGYANSMMSLYNGLAYIKFSMNYYTFFEMTKDTESGMAEDEKFTELMNKLNEIVDEEILSDMSDSSDAPKRESESASGNLEKLAGIREEIIKIMEVVTAYVDRLRIYEHVLNRIEYRFREEPFDDSYYNQELTNDLMHYIFSDNDSVAVNNRISEVIEQLPMRLTKNKFYEYIREAFTLYKDAQVGTIDDFAYTLGTTGMLYEPEGFDTMFPKVYELYKEIAGANYQDIAKGNYESAKARLTIAGDKMSDMADIYVMFAQLVNDLYTLLLSKQYVLGDVDETIRARRVISIVADDFKRGNILNAAVIDERLDDLTDDFISFEGKQERIGETVFANDFAVSSALEDYYDELVKEGLLEEYERLADIIKLQSGSDFVSLKEDKAKLEEAGREYTQKVCEELIEAFDTSFKTMDRIVRRAVMSSVLAQLPVFFNSVDEIQGYINMSLMFCSDISEKQACVEVFRLVMQG